MTPEEIKAKLEENENRMAEIDARKAEMEKRTAAGVAEDFDLEAYEADIEKLSADRREVEAEIRSLNEQLETLKNAAVKAAETRKAVAAGDGEIITTFKEEKRMSDIIYSVDSKEYRNAYVKNLFKRNLDEVETRSLTSAAAVIPTTMVNDVIGKLKETPILGVVSLSQFPNYVRFPVVSASATAAAAAIGSSITEGTNTVGYVDLAPNEYTKLISLQSDIQNMAIDALYTWLVENITNEIRAKIAADVLVGSGTNCCKGISASVQANATNLHSTVTKADVLAVMAALDSRYHADAVWVMTPAVFYGEVMAATALNDYIVNEGFQQRLFGHPVILMSEACISTKETIFFGDPTQYKLNLFTPIQIKPFETATSLDVQYRGGCLADGELADTNAFVRFAKA